MSRLNRRRLTGLLLGGLLVVGLPAVSASTASAITFRPPPPGSLDTSWGGTGKVATSFGGADTAQAVATQADGKIVVAGTTISASTSQMALARYNTNGTLDTSFGTAGTGKVIVPPFLANTNGDFGYGVAIQANGDIVIVGSASSFDGTNLDGAVALARYTTNGVLDTTFGTKGTGQVTANIDPNPGDNGDYLSANAVAIESDGDIVIAGADMNGAEVARFTSSGARDPSFNGTGYREFDFGPGIDTAYGVGVTSGGYIVVGGAAYAAGQASGPSTPGLAELTSSGGFNSSFGSGGMVSSTTSGLITSLTVEASGTIVTAGSYGPFDGTDNLTVAAYNSAGTNAFQKGTAVVTNTSDFGSFPGSGVATLPDGSILAASTSAGNNGDLALVKVTSGGAMDMSFGAGGVVTTDVSSGSFDHGNALALDAHDRAVVVGSTAASSSAASSFEVARYLTDAQSTITTQPASATACGGSTTLTVAATSPVTPISYQWQSSTNDSTFTNIVGATNTTYQVTGLTPATSPMYYRVVVSNGGGDLTSSVATVSYGTGPVVTTQPASVSVSDGATVSFSAAASGPPAPTVQWQVAPAASSTFTNAPGASTTSPYTFAATTAESGNQYQAVFTNACGTATSNPATLTVAPVTNHQLIISQFRLAGPSSPNGLDWYADVFNPGSSPVNLSGWKLNLDTSGGETPVVLSPVTVPAHGSFLVAGANYSVPGSSPDQEVDQAAVTPGGVAIVAPDGVVTDRAGEVGAPADLVATAGLAVPPITTAEGTFVRTFAGGVPVDTDNNAADFRWVATDGGSASDPTVTLGAPNPLASGSAMSDNAVGYSTLFDTTPPATAATAPNRVLVGNILTVRRTITNPAGSGVTLKSLRLLITSITTYGTDTSTSQAILEPVSSSNETVNGVAVLGTTLDPVSAAGGGGLGSSLGVALPGGALTSGSAVNVDLAFKVVRGGSFSFGYNDEVTLGP